MHSAGTTIGTDFLPLLFLNHQISLLTYCWVEGPWDEVMHVIGLAHTMLHEKGVQRIQSDIRVGSR